MRKISTCYIVFLLSCILVKSTCVDGLAAFPGRLPCRASYELRTVQAATGALDWLTLWWLASLAAWAAAFIVYYMVRTERLQVPWLRMLNQDAGDIETGSPAVHIVGGVVERR